MEFIFSFCYGLDSLLFCSFVRIGGLRCDRQGSRGLIDLDYIRRIRSTISNETK